MFMKTLIATALLATVLPGAMAAQTTITTTTQGVITSSSLRNYTDIRPGESFELTTVMRFDPMWVEQVDAYTQRAHGTADYTFKVADRTYQFSSYEGYAVLDVETREYSGTKYLSLDMDLQDYFNWEYRLTSSIGWTGDTYTPPTNLLTADSFEYTYTAPFKRYLNFAEFAGGGERTGDIYTNVTSIHVAVTSVPEPATYAMLGAGLGLMALSRRKRRTEPETSPA